MNLKRGEEEEKTEGRKGMRMEGEEETPNLMPQNCGLLV